MSGLEEHMTVKEIAALWKCHRTTVGRIIRRYPHLIPDLAKKRRSKFGPIKRHCAHLRVPRSVVERIYRDLIGDKNAV